MAGGMIVIAFAIQLSDTPPHIRSQLNPCHIRQGHGNSRFRDRQRDPREVVKGLQVAAGAHHVLACTQFERRPPFCFAFCTASTAPR